VPVCYDWWVETEPGTREKNKNERRQALLDAAYALFRTRGYQATTMDDVADAAGLSRRTAFRYFATKEELLFPDRAERLALLKAELARSENETPFERVRRACIAVGREYQADRVHMLAQWRITQSEPSLRLREMELGHEFEACIAEVFTVSRSEREARLARVRAAAVVAAMRATIEGWLAAGAEDDLLRLGREALGELERGLGPRG
jgi:AcrR family transcriptional regulator